MATGGDLTGKTIGKCRILERLGHGRTSRIYRAFYEPLGKEVAVKILKKDAKATDEIREKFLNEARALGRLDHPNIVKVFDVVEEGPWLFIIMELLDGEDLYRILEEGGHIEADEAVEIVHRVAKALAEAHRQDIIHRDVKPANIMLAGPRGDVKLVDFGLATEGVTAGRAGTPHYMSPEQIQGKPVTDKSDIYSLGATFFHMLTGRPPYPAKTAKVIMEKHVEGNLPTPSRAGKAAGVPKAVDPVVKKMMAPIPGYRSTARDLIDVLASLNLAAGGRRRKTRTIRAASRRSRKVPLIAGIAVAGVAIVAVALVVAFSGGGGKKPIDTDPGVKATAGGTGGVNTLNVNRADDAQTRKVMAKRQFQDAQAFEAQNYGKDQEIYDRYKKVWDEYGDTAYGEKARAEMKQAEDRMNATKIEAERREAQKKLEKALPELKADLAKLGLKFDFPSMYERILKFMEENDLEDGDEQKWVEYGRRLEWADRFILDLAKDITENPKKLRVKLFKEDAPENATIQSADETSVIIREGTLDVKKEWGYFKPDELARLAGRQMNIRRAMTHYLFANFYFALDRPEDFENSLMEAKGLDQMNEIEAYERKVKEKLRGKMAPRLRHEDEGD